MRKFWMLLSLGVAVSLASAVLAADGNDGPGMTTSQKISSLFGLIDRSANAPPPPTPPGMPPMNSHGVVRVPFAPRNGRPTPANNAPQRTQQSAKLPAAAGAVPRDASLPQPPQPLRMSDAAADAKPLTVDGVAVVSDEPTNRTTPTPTQPRTSIVGASKQPLFAGTAAGSSAIGRSNGAATSSGAAAQTNSSGADSGQPTAAQVAKPFVSSRRRVTQSEEAPSTSPNASSIVGKSEPATTPAASPLDSLTTIPLTPNTTSAAKQPAPLEPPMPKSTAGNDGPGLMPSVDEPLLHAARSQPTMTPPAPKAAPPISTPIATPTPSAAATPAIGATAGSAGDRGNVLTSFTNPGLTVETIGPPRAAIGRETSYRVVVRNTGDGEARDVLVSVQLPEQAELAELQGTAGSSTSPGENARGAALQWKLDTLRPRSQEELKITLVPKSSDSLELGVRWTASSPVSRAVVEVEEPKLAMVITGPNEVAFGEQRLFKLTVTNPGTGDAENVVLQLMPLAPGDGEPLRHTIGTIKPGESSVIEVELTARQSGALRIRTEASAEGGLHTEAVADVLVRRAVLDVVAAAPRVLFAGVPGTYEFKVRNTGDDSARNVRVAVDLPSGAKLLDVVPAVRGESSDKQLSWTVDRIAPGSEQTFTVKCEWERGGDQQLNVNVVADGDVRKSLVAATSVQAVADLALDVVDTPGPVPVGSPVTYEIRVKNRGLKAAEGVDVVAYFSEGIEPERAEGQMHEIQPGVVIFQSLSSVGPGQEKVLKVTARAQTSGNHRLRVELHGATPQTQLSHEDATFFYDDAAPSPPNLSSPGSFEPEEATPISPTGATATPGARQPVVNAAAPDYRVNKMR